MGVGPDPIKIKWLTRPLTLHWDGVGRKLQLMILTALTDVDVVLGMDVLSQLDVKINFKKQVASLAREACTPLEPAKTVGLLLDNPGFTFKGKILVKEEGVEEVAKGVLRPAYREVHRIWMASERKMKTKDKREDCKIVQESSMPWNQAGYKAQLQKDLKDIQQKFSRVLGQDLAKSDNLFVEATSPVNCTEGGVLVDLCMQRSGKRGSGCDAPKSADRFPRSADGSFKSSEGFPTPVTSPLRPPKPPRTEIRQYSWRNFTNKEVCMHIRTLKPFKSKMEKQELKFKSQGTTNCRNHSDVIVSGVIATSSIGDVTIRDIGDGNRPVARKRYAPTKHSFMHTKEFLKGTLNICKQSFIQVAAILAVVISILGSLLNTNLLKLICTAGLAAVACQECESGNNSNGTLPLLPISFLDYSILAILRESTAAIINISKGLCSCIQKLMVLDNKKQLIRCMEVLQNMIIRGVTILSYYYATRESTTFPGNVSAGKHVNAYIFPSADFYASWVDCLDTYAENLESECKITIFCNLEYICMYAFCRSWVSCSWATYPKVILYTLVYFSLNWIVSVIRSHDKYQSIILVGLALTEKARSRIQCILFHFRSYWRELRPLVTPWADCIKEGIEPRIFQKRFMPSHAQVSLPLLSLLSLPLILLCFCFYCSSSYYHYHYYYYEYLLVKGFHNSSGYGNKPEPDYSNSYKCKPGHFNKQKLLSLSLFLSFTLLFSLPMLLTIVCGAGNLTHTISPACLSLLLSLSLLMTIVCGAGNLTHTISPVCLSLLLSLSLLMTIVCGAGNLTHAISPACLSLLLSLSLLMTIVCGAGNLTHTISPVCLSLLLSLSLPMTIVCGAGDLTHTISPARWSLLLSLSLLMTIVCGAGNLTHTISPACLSLLPSLSMLMTILCGAGNLTHTISPACLCLLPSLSMLMTIVCGAGNLTQQYHHLACLF